MRPLTDDELKLVFEKLAKYIGRDVEALITRVDDPHCFRVVKNRVYYISEAIMRLSTNVSRDNTVSVGTCFGKMDTGDLVGRKQPFTLRRRWLVFKR